MALTPLVVTDWVADSDASNHTTSDAGNLIAVLPPTSTDPSSIIVGNKSALPVTSIGDSTLPNPFYLNNVLVTPDIIQNLLCVHRFTTHNWCFMEFDPFDLSVKDRSMRNVVTKCNSSRPLYTVCLPSHPATLSHVAAPLAMLHRRLLGIDVSAILVSMSYQNCLIILVSYALGTLMTFVMLASLVIILTYLLSVLILMWIIIFI
jgi:hypothetical protein